MIEIQMPQLCWLLIAGQLGTAEDSVGIPDERSRRLSDDIKDHVPDSDDPDFMADDFIQISLTAEDAHLVKAIATAQHMQMFMDPERNGKPTERMMRDVVEYLKKAVPGEVVAEWEDNTVN